MSVAESGRSEPSYGDESIEHINDDLVEIGQDLQIPTHLIIAHTQKLLDYAKTDEEFQDFMPDLDRMLRAGKQLITLIIKVFSKTNFPDGQINLAAFGSTIRHDLRTPINAFIGYSEMLLEDVNEETHQQACDDLQKILTLARKLLGIVGDLSYLTISDLNHLTKADTENKKINTLATDTVTLSEKQPEQIVTTTKNNTHNGTKKNPVPAKKTTTPVANAPVPPPTVTKSTNYNELIGVGNELKNLTNHIITATETILVIAEQEGNYKSFIPDLNKTLSASKQLLNLITHLFSQDSTAVGQVETEAFTSTIRHDLRTPINAIIGYSEMLLEDIEESDEYPTRSHLEKILATARRLLTLINDLTHLHKPDVTQKKTEIEPEASATLMDEVVRTMHTVESNAVDLTTQDASLLVVDDKDSNRDLLSRRLEKQGFKVDVAENGLQALQKIRKNNYDLVLLDIIMPEMNGYQVLAEMKMDDKLRHIPVIMISALDEIDSVVRCIEMGAEDYLQKPFNQVILKAKISATLERKRLRDREHAFLQKLQVEQEKSEKLLLNILPKPIADRLKKGARTIADNFSEVTVLFSDLVGFTEMCTGISAVELVEKLNDIFLAFDILAELHGLEKIKTIGDAYMLVGGLPTPRSDHAEAVADMAIDMFDAIERLNRQNNSNIRIRVGIHTGPVVAGVIGKNKFNYDLWGDAVNVASRMESHGVPGKIQVSEATYAKLKGKFDLEKRGIIEVKGKGEMTTYFLNGH